MIPYFLQHIKFEKRCSKHTLSAYTSDLEQFSIYLKNTYELTEAEQADFQMIRSWIAALAEKKLDNRSINRKIATLRAYYGFLLRQKTIVKDPMLLIRSLKTDKQLPSFVREQEMHHLLDDLAFTEDFAGQRDRVVLELLYGTGMRLSELIELKISDLNTYEKTLTVLGKRNKQRILPLPNPLYQLLSQYLKLRDELEIPDEWLILSDNGRKAYPVFIQRIVRKYLSLVSSLEKKSPHVLRHSFATHLLNNGADLNAIKDLMGHSSLAATQVYTHNSIEKLKEAYLQAHPKA
ncbi:tyrosine-type recombinase/integrase [Siphonobacter aquaeclarae]|uniref:Tyrosine recombinase XerC n=1 Tax=Siphonobacter aquaeclarae TaxID=563176 RepID=A0A1G9R6C7_9BACT|nr:tyrosine-type recombinase/integrase [Siphonobacter aquaeclarae]SDM17985.1 integrase/recombinase XerC [Siphonobacter aquaeclarae]